MTYVVEMRNITKSFPGVIADSNVNFQVKPGEIHALVGENGAGKTTLMNILYGLYQPEEGQILIRGEKVSIKNPHEAIKKGIGMVHQHFMLVPNLTVLENIILGREYSRFGLTDYKTAENKVDEIARQYSLDVDLKARVFELSVGEMQRVEILKSLVRGAQILILDEPTAVLTPQETIRLFDILRTLTSQGRSIVFISHKLKEVLAISDRITVMQNGRVTGLVNTAETNEMELACLMVGRKVIFRVHKTPARPGEEILCAKNLSTLNDRGLIALKQVNFNIRRGEIVGVAGVEGNGQNELVEVLTGLKKQTSGEIIFKGKPIQILSPRRRRERGFAHIPADRLLMGVNTKCSISENLILNTYYRPPQARFNILNWEKIHDYVQNLIRQFSIITTNPQIPASSLSGGNMQKLVLARELAGDPDLLIASQPTRGVDVGAIEYIHSQIIELRDRGHAVLLVSAELDEIMSLSDRILVMYEGEFVGEFQSEAVTENELGLYMAGARRMDQTTPVGVQDHSQES